MCDVNFLDKAVFAKNNNFIYSRVVISGVCVAFNEIRGLIGRIQLKQVQALDTKFEEEKAARRKLRGEREKDVSEILDLMANPPDETDEQQVAPSQESTDEQPKGPITPQGDFPPPIITS